MDYSKRKNGGPAVADDADLERASKRLRRIPSTDEIDLMQGETPETTSKYGLQLLEQVKKTEDKSGRPVATNFLTLPNRRQVPDYYNVIKMPIAIDTIEAKLMRKEFPNLSALESYFKRMVSNAKEYNEKISEIYSDAERLRKALSNFMTKVNPAYKTIPGYVAVPTPLPEGALSPTSEADAEGEIDTEFSPAPTKSRGRASKKLQVRRKSSTPATSDQQYAGVSFTGLTFQQAQEKVVADMITYYEDPEDELPHFDVFINLPSRSLKDYYQVIPYPLSLKGLQKRVLGIRGRKESSGVTDFKTWAAFEEETSNIWKNAWHYNEDGSEIYNRAKELETFFYKALQEAKQAVSEPAAPKLKLKMAEPERKITLKLGGKARPADMPSPQLSGTSQEGGSNMNGGIRKTPFGGSSSIPMSNLDQLDRARSISAPVPSPAPPNVAVKNELLARNSPMPTAGYSSTATATTPNLPGALMRPPSTPGLSNPAYNQTQYAQSFNHNTQQATNAGFEPRWRPQGRDASHALISNLSISTSPELNVARHFQINIPPFNTMAQQSVTMHLPASHYRVWIKPELAPSLTDRQYKLFVNVVNAAGSSRLQSLDARSPLYDHRLTPGVNRIEVELIAALPKGTPKPANGQDAELEKITVLANLAKAPNS